MTPKTLEDKLQALQCIFDTFTEENQSFLFLHAVVNEEDDTSFGFATKSNIVNLAFMFAALFRENKTFMIAAKNAIELIEEKYKSKSKSAN